MPLVAGSLPLVRITIGDVSLSHLSFSFRAKGGTMRRLLAVMAMAGFVVAIPATAFADPSPNGPGQPGAPGTTCGSSNATSSTPGGSASAPGSPFNPNGQAGAVYAGNPGTASADHSQSGNAISQYDIACFQVTPGH
jgi:hypothetical protein